MTLFMLVFAVVGMALILLPLGSAAWQSRQHHNRHRPLFAALALLFLGCGVADAGPLARLHAKRHPAATAGCTSCHSQPQATFAQTGTLTLPAIQCQPCSPLPAVALPPLPTCKPCETCPTCPPASPQRIPHPFESSVPAGPTYPAPMTSVRQPGVLSTITQAACPNGKCPLKK